MWPGGGHELRGEGASLLARLADGGLRDALSLLDQCAGPSGPIGEQEVLDALGLAGNLETARLMEQLGGETPPGPWRPWPGCTARGRTWALCWASCPP